MTPARAGSYNLPATRDPSHITPGGRVIRPYAVATGRRIRPVARLLLAAAVLSLVPGPSRAAAAAAPGNAEGARVIAEDLRGVTLEFVAGASRWDTLAVAERSYERVRVQGASIVEPPGRPALPTAILSIAVPDGMSPRLRIESEETVDRPGLAPLPVAAERFVADGPETGPVSEFRYEPESAIYAGVRPYPAEVATLGAGNAVGELWVVPVRVAPVRWNPATRAYRMLRRARIRIDFVPASDRERLLRTTARPGTDSEVWRRIQRRVVANQASALSFPRRPRETARAPGARRLLDGNPEFRVSVTQTGWTSVSQSVLAGAGFPAGVSIAKIGVWERGYSDAGDSATATAIPVVARDANSNGLFDAGDAITFYARSLRDRVGPLSIENRYADANVYWITWTTADAAVPDTITGVNPSPSVTSPTFFRDVLHLEQDLSMFSTPNQTVASPPEAVPYFFWTSGGEPGLFDTTIPFVDPATAQPIRIRARYQGLLGSLHRLSIFFESSTGARDTLALNDVFFNQEVYALDTGYTIPGTLIGPGANKYVHVGDRQSLSGGVFLPGSSAGLDWVDVDYAHQYVARNDRLAFTSGGSGSVAELTITGFTSPAIEIYDVTVPTAAERVVGAVVGGSAGAYQVTFRTDSFAAERRFVALVAGAAAPVPPSDVAADTPSSLRTPGPFGSSEARAIMIAPGAFMAAATRLADYRRGQGYAVELADVQDVYDEFSGGVKSARAIRRYLRHAYLAWSPGPTFVVLLGDASMDYRHRLAASSVDWVPTYLKFETIAGPQGAELVAQDPYYVVNLGLPEPADNDVLPNLLLGRVPASSLAELDAYVTKVIAYEAYQPTDAWRGRQLLVSDDQYSSTIYFTGGYCLQPQEALFRQSNQQMADAAAASASGQDLTTIFFDLKPFTDASPTFIDGFGNTCKSLNITVSTLNQTGGGTDQFAQRLNQGALLVNVQAHANRYLVAHEQLVCVSPQFCAAGISPDLVQNVGRPFLWMVWGCHANQFPDGPRGGATVDSTDAQGEQFLLLPNRGAIVTFGSTAYEFLQTNSTFNTFVSEAFYTVPPVIGPDHRARWIAGEIFQHAFTRNAQTGFFTQQIMNRTLHVLGDPMVRMDALAPRIFEVTLDGTPAVAGASFSTDSPVDSLALSVKVRDEVAVSRVTVFERDVRSGTVTPVDSTLFSLVLGDSARQATLQGNVRPHVGNYDFVVQATDYNGRIQEFPLAVRTPIRYFANGIEIIDGVFVVSGAMLRAEITAPIPLTADSLTLLLDDVPIAAVPTALDGTGRRWALESLAGDRGPGAHSLSVAVSGRSAGLDVASFQVSSEFTLRGVAVVDPRRQGAGCDGSIFQYELSAPATHVELKLYTVAGRRVASLPLPGAAGYNVFCWDGRDAQGHETATGLYLYRIRATDETGRSLDYDGRMIRSR